MLARHLPRQLSRFALVAAVVCAATMRADEPQAEAAEAEKPAPVFTVPFADVIRIDGQPDEWGAVGVAQGRLEAARGNDEVAPEDLEAHLSLVWNDAGLLVLVQVTDDAAAEVPENSELYLHDSVELFMVRGEEKVQHVIAPGIAEAVPDPCHQAIDHREDAKRVGERPAEITYQAARTDRGYAIEALLPWDTLDIDAAVGTQLRLQVLVNDADSPNDSRVIYSWYPEANTHRDNGMTHRIRLAPTRHPLVLAHQPGRRIFTSNRCAAKRTWRGTAEPLLVRSHGSAFGCH
jgi:hypothetical protein